MDPTKLPEKIEVIEPVTLKDLSSALGVRAPYLIKKLLEEGKPTQINQPGKRKDRTSRMAIRA